jgi:hypothetical protein
LLFGGLGFVYSPLFWIGIIVVMLLAGGFSRGHYHY